MYKNIFLGVFFPYVTHADEISTPLTVAIVSSENSEIQISTTKDTLRGDNVLICLAEKKYCIAYHGSDFSSVKPNNFVEDVATGGNIYTYSLGGFKTEKLQGGIILAFILSGNNIKVSDVRFDGQHSFIIKSSKVEDIISYCTGSEGVHVLSKFGGIHLYYSLGYDVEANCSDEVYK